MVRNGIKHQKYQTENRSITFIMQVHLPKQYFSDDFTAGQGGDGGVSSSVDTLCLVHETQQGCKALAVWVFHGRLCLLSERLHPLKGSIPGYFMQHWRGSVEGDAGKAVLCVGGLFFFFPLRHATLFMQFSFLLIADESSACTAHIWRQKLKHDQN